MTDFYLVFVSQQKEPSRSIKRKSILRFESWLARFFDMKAWCTINPRVRTLMDESKRSVTSPKQILVQPQVFGSDKSGNALNVKKSKPLVHHNIREFTSGSIKTKACYWLSGHSPRVRGPVNVGYGDRSPHHSANSTHIKEVMPSVMLENTERQTDRQPKKQHTHTHTPLQ